MMFREGAKVKLWTLIKEPFELDWILSPSKHFITLRKFSMYHGGGLKWKESTGAVHFSPFISGFFLL